MRDLCSYCIDWQALPNPHHTSPCNPREPSLIFLDGFQSEHSCCLLPLISAGSLCCPLRRFRSDLGSFPPVLSAPLPRSASLMLTSSSSDPVFSRCERSESVLRCQDGNGSQPQPATPAPFDPQHQCSCHLHSASSHTLVYCDTHSHVPADRHKAHKTLLGSHFY